MSPVAVQIEKPTAASQPGSSLSPTASPPPVSPSAVIGSPSRTAAPDSRVQGALAPVGDRDVALFQALWNRIQGDRYPLVETGIRDPKTSAAVNAAVSKFGLMSWDIDGALLEKMARQGDPFRVDDGLADLIAASRTDSLQATYWDKSGLGNRREEFISAVAEAAVRPESDLAARIDRPGTPIPGEVTTRELGLMIEVLKGYDRDMRSGGGAFNQREKKALAEMIQQLLGAWADPEQRAAMTETSAARDQTRQSLEEINTAYGAYLERQRKSTNSAAFWGAVTAGGLAVATCLIVAAATTTAPIWGTIGVAASLAAGVTLGIMKLAGRGNDYRGAELARDVGMTALGCVAGIAAGPVLGWLGKLPLFAAVGNVLPRLAPSGPTLEVLKKVAPWAIAAAAAAGGWIAHSFFTKKDSAPQEAAPADSTQH